MTSVNVPSPLFRKICDGPAGTAGHVVGRDHEVGPAAAVEVDELRDARVGRDAAEAGRIGHVGEVAPGRGRGVVAEELRVVARLAEQQDIELAVAVVIADRGAVAHVALHQVAVRVDAGKPVRNRP